MRRQGRRVEVARLARDGDDGRAGCSVADVEHASREVDSEPARRFSVAPVEMNGLCVCVVDVKVAVEGGMGVAEWDQFGQPFDDGAVEGVAQFVWGVVVAVDGSTSPVRSIAVRSFSTASRPT
jgi:hypothetical protein